MYGNKILITPHSIPSFSIYVNVLDFHIYYFLILAPWLILCKLFDPQSLEELNSEFLYGQSKLNISIIINGPLQFRVCVDNKIHCEYINCVYYTLRKSSKYRCRSCKTCSQKTERGTFVFFCQVNILR